MKTTVIVLLFIPNLIFGNPPKVNLSQEQEISYSEIIEFDDLSADELFPVLKEWFVLTFEVPESELILDNKEQRKIVGKAEFEAKTKSLGQLHRAGIIKCTISIEIRDGRFQITLSNNSVLNV